MKSEDRVFPQVTKGDKNAGITVRDYIAIQAMQGIITNDHLLSALVATADSGLRVRESLVATLAYTFAEKMIEESENGRG